MTDYQFDDDDPQRCPVCGATREGHRRIQQIANELRAEYGQPPLDPPDIQTGIQQR